MGVQSKIRVLTEHTINKIAAGEVIENPASVIKELVENSIDAGSKTICVEIQNGGRQLIRITDDGCGMSHDDALLSLERHATSKIKEVDDIQEITTMGFRGEAIPSIASISKFTLLTCPRTDDGTEAGGTLVCVDGGRIVSCAGAARSPGTTIEVKSLFFNVPVRRKFQKSPAYDIHEIQKMLSLLALGYPNVQFELISDQKTLLKTCPPLEEISFSDQLRKRIEDVLGKVVSGPLLPVSFEQPPFGIHGFIAPPSIHKPNRTGQYLFINHRAVFSPLVSTAVKEGYGTMLPAQRFPFFILHLSLPGSLVDVNVHPQKKEVRLRQESQLKEIIIRAIQSTFLQEQGKRPEHQHYGFTKPCQDGETVPPYWGPYATLLSPSKKEEEGDWEFRTNNRSNVIEKDSLAIEQDKAMPKWETKWNLDDASVRTAPFETKVLQQFPEKHQNHEPTSQLQPFPINHRQQLPKMETSLPFSNDRVQVVSTLVGYCLIEPFGLARKLFGSDCDKKEGGLALIDQRAAFSRIHYEKLIKRADQVNVHSLLIPLTLQVSSIESRLIVEQLEVLNAMGFSLREFGTNTFMVDAIPAFMKTSDIQQMLVLMVQDLVDMDSSRRLQIKKEEQLALAACRHSIPSTKKLSIEEAEGLLKQLLACDQPAQCPFGKKISVYFSPEEVSKWFSMMQGVSS
jgi:DNA mismatch repair protein MutL